MKVAIVGHFGGGHTFTDGQTIKVVSLHNGLLKYDKDIKIVKIDTYYYGKNNIKLAFALIKGLFLAKTIIFLPAFRGRQTLFRLMYVFAKLFRKRVYHDSIGGGLPGEIPNHPKWVKYLNSYRYNWMESEVLVEKLVEQGIKNAMYLPNFKNLEPAEALPYKGNTIYKFCIFCRIMPEKGIEDAVDAVISLNEEGYKLSLDLFGPVAEKHEEWFANLSMKFGNLISYKGVVDPDKSVDALSNYFCMLFPTRYYTEGMPGTIVDAMFAGTPVISRKWGYCDQMIKDKYNGLVYDFDKPDMLAETMKYAMDNFEMVNRMKLNCIHESYKYSEKNGIDRILKMLREK